MKLRVLAHLPAAIKRRALSEVWLGEVVWRFPTWSVRKRPFDWHIDQDDIPVPPEDRWHRGNRRQFNLYLRPAEAVVQR